ncbi:MAG: TetR/AcrR family transcriptional regulator [Sphingobium sp.]
MNDEEQSERAPQHKTLQRRRLPRQQRARETVEAIFEATEQLVATHGFNAVNTRMIAERAGVGIGSLYQYFPTYEAILLAWYERVSTMAAQQIRLATIEVMDQRPVEAVHNALRRLLDLYMEYRLPLIEMPHQVPQIEEVIRHTSLEVLNRGTIRLYLGQHPEFDATRTESQVFFLETVVHAVLRRYVRETPDFLEPEEVVEQIALSILPYLAQRGVGKGPPESTDNQERNAQS